MNRVKRIATISFLLAALGVIFLFISYRVQNSTGSIQQSVVFAIEKGENLVDVAGKLKEKKAIASSFYFIYYVWTRDLSTKIVAGEYEIAPEMKIPEIVQMLVKGETKPGYVKITFPEGWTAKQMSERLTEKNLPGKEFMDLVENPTQEVLLGHDFFQGKPVKASLEGYLFPDTYFFAVDASAAEIIVKMLKNFDTRLSSDLREKISSSGKSYFDIITMASVIEGEVSNERDRGLVSGIFWKRIEIGMPLQSCATIAYALGIKKIQYDAADIKIDSPYNTYENKGLPVGPVSNPGLASISAAINPTDSNYLYFLNNPETGETFFSETFEEHVKNKSAVGL